MIDPNTLQSNLDAFDASGGGMPQAQTPEQQEMLDRLAAVNAQYAPPPMLASNASMPGPSMTAAPPPMSAEAPDVAPIQAGPMSSEPLASEAPPPPPAVNMSENPIGPTPPAPPPPPITYGQVFKNEEATVPLEGAGPVVKPAAPSKLSSLENESKVLNSARETLVQRQGELAARQQKGQAGVIGEMVTRRAAKARANEDAEDDARIAGSKMESAISAGDRERDEAVKNFDPDRLIHSKNTGQHFAIALGLMFGGALQGGGWTKTNPFSDWLTQQAAGDVDAQKMLIDNAKTKVAGLQTAYGRHLQRTGDDRLARAEATKDALAGLELKARAQMAEDGVDITSNQGQQALNEIQRAQVEAAKAAEKERARAIAGAEEHARKARLEEREQARKELETTGNLEAKGLEIDAKNRETDAKTQEASGKKRVPLINGTAPDETIAKKVNEELGRFNLGINAMRKVAMLRRQISEAGMAADKVLPSHLLTQLESNVAAATASLNTGFGQGAITGSDGTRTMKLLGNPTNFWSTNADTIDELANQMETHAINQAEGMGVAIDGKKATTIKPRDFVFTPKNN